MNINPPPEFGKSGYFPQETQEQQIKRLENIVAENEEKIQRLLQWCRDLYEFLKYPVYHKLRMYPRTANESDPVDGDIIYNTTDDKLRIYTGSSFEDCN